MAAPPPAPRGGDWEVGRRGRGMRAGRGPRGREPGGGGAAGAALRGADPQL